jgi:hypothetical protein
MRYSAVRADVAGRFDGAFARRGQRAPHGLHRVRLGEIGRVIFGALFVCVVVGIDAVELDADGIERGQGALVIDGRGRRGRGRERRGGQLASAGRLARPSAARRVLWPSAGIASPVAGIVEFGILFFPRF